MSLIQCWLMVSTILMASYSNSAKPPTIVPITEPVDHGEGPVWDHRTNLLYFVDIHSGKLLSYNNATHSVNSIKFDAEVSLVIPSKSHPELLIVCQNRSVAAVRWNGAKSLEADHPPEFKVLTTVSETFPRSRFNDGKADKKGNLWLGTMGYEDDKGVSPNEGSLYHITKENIANPDPVIKPVNVSNGLAWNRANDKFYFIDSGSGKVVQYHYNETTITEPKTVFDMEDHKNLKGVPDGMTIDTDDNLWIALYGGSAVIKVNPESGEVLQVVDLPVLYVTSATWGGENLEVLYVTTSRYRLGAEERVKQPNAGSVFAVTGLGARGFPAFQSDIID